MLTADISQGNSSPDVVVMETGLFHLLDVTARKGKARFSAVNTYRVSLHTQPLRSSNNGQKDTTPCPSGWPVFPLEASGSEPVAKQGGGVGGGNC